MQAPGSPGSLASPSFIFPGGGAAGGLPQRPQSPSGAAAAAAYAAFAAAQRHQQQQQQLVIGGGGLPSPSALSPNTLLAGAAAGNAQQMALLMAQSAQGIQHPLVPTGAAAGSTAAPMYVNAKQYPRILKRREARSRWEAGYMARKAAGTAGPLASLAFLENGGAGARGGPATLLNATQQGYIHESRHRHAVKRARGPGGRFLSIPEIQALEAAAKKQKKQAAKAAAAAASSSGPAAGSSRRPSAASSSKEPSPRLAVGN